MSLKSPHTPSILISDPIDPSGINLLAEHAHIDIKTDLTTGQLVDIIEKYDGIILRNRTKLTAEVIRAATKLKVIGRAGSGLDNIDVTTASELGIRVVNTPESSTVAVAEMVMGLMIVLARQLIQADNSMKQGEWEKPDLTGFNLASKTLGVVGFGRIGRQVAMRAKAFGMKVVVNQLRPTPQLNLQLGVDNLDLTELLQISDFVSVHVPLRPSTVALFGHNEFSMMKSSAFLINTARAEIIDQEALQEALTEGEIAGAAIDVFPEEPTKDYTLAQLPNVVATPHIAASTQEAQQAVSLNIAQQMIDILNESEPTTLLPLAVVPMESIVPHESIDQKRVDRLKGRLEKEGILSNPPIVTPLEDRYMVLDGATRTAALRQLGYPHAVVQISTEEDGLALNTWYHVIQKIQSEVLLSLIQQMPHISLVRTELEKASENMFEYGALCYIHFVNGDVYLIQSDAGENRLNALNHLTESYINAAFVDRTLEADMGRLRHEFPEMAAVVVFPEYTVSQVRQVTLSGRYFPAGITRFIIPGRILRVNAELDILKSKEMTLNEKNRWLHNHLENKIQGNSVRFYRESVYLLDE
ncbi:MAG: NAD(P)-dependent oxidoreductase [Chloroflexota bacterium]